MINFEDIFSVFSKRNKKAEAFIPGTFRNRIIMFINDNFFETQWGDYRYTLWEEIHGRIAYRLGKPQLSKGYSDSKPEDLMDYLSVCSGNEFLDFIEDLFQSSNFHRAKMNEDKIVDTINLFINQDNLGFFLTNFVKEKTKEFSMGRERDVIKTTQYPRVIIKDNQISHALAITPTLEFLENLIFKTANEEFLDALEDYRKGDYGDCLTKCGSAFESVMKIICDKKRWKYKQSDTASTLVKIMIQKTQLDTYFEQILMIVATLRNRLSKSHGAGTKPKSVPSHIAQYALNSTAAAILLLVKEVKL